MLTSPRKSVRNINFDCLHQRQGHYDITADVDLVHLDPVMQTCLLFCFKYGPWYRGMSSGQRRLYEALSRSMTDGGTRTVAVIALHNDDVLEKSDISAADAVVCEVFEPRIGKWVRILKPIPLPIFADKHKERVRRERAEEMLRRVRR